MTISCFIIDVEPDHTHVIFTLVCKEDVAALSLSELDRAIMNGAGEPDATTSEQLRALAMLAQRFEEAA